MELVDRKEVNELLHRQRDMQSRVNQLPTYDACYLGSPCEYQNENIKMPPQTGWIPVTEKLPEKTGWYLCTLSGHLAQTMVDMCRFEIATGGYWSGGIEYEVVAWMELPKPYEEGAEE